MKFSIVTPSFRGISWLKLCVASVRDQNVAYEHIIQDAGSDDGTQEWLATQSDLLVYCERDQGMYDAINRGLKRSTGDILGFLNCDEQYLPGALVAVRDHFRAHPSAEIVFANAVVVDEGGGFICYRKAIRPEKYHTWITSNLAILTCATFFRGGLIHHRGLFFDAGMHAVGDSEWIMRLIDKKISMSLLPRFTSIFTETGHNMGISEKGKREQKAFVQTAPVLVRACKGLVVWHHRIRRFLGGAYRQDPFQYSIFTRDSPGERKSFDVESPRYRWVR